MFNKYILTALYVSDSVPGARDTAVSNKVGSFPHGAISSWEKETHTEGIKELVRVKVDQWCPTVCNPMNRSPPGSSVHGILQERIMEWVAIPFSRGSSQPRDWAQVSGIAGGFFTIWATWETMVKLRETHFISGAKEGFSQKGHLSWVEKQLLGLPQWLNGKESACQCGRQVFDPWSGKITHGVGQLSLCATLLSLCCRACKPQLLSPQATTLEPVLQNKRSHYNEKLMHRS